MLCFLTLRLSVWDMLPSIEIYICKTGKVLECQAFKRVSCDLYIAKCKISLTPDRSECLSPSAVHFNCCERATAPFWSGWFRALVLSVQMRKHFENRSNSAITGDVRGSRTCVEWLHDRGTHWHFQCENPVSISKHHRRFSEIPLFWTEPSPARKAYVPLSETRSGQSQKHKPDSFIIYAENENEQDRKIEKCSS